MPIEFGSFSLGAIAGGIIIGVANHFLSKSRSEEYRKIGEFNKAADKFRDTFIVQLNVLESDVNSGSGDTSDIGGYLNSRYVATHLNAFRTFKYSLSDKERIAIDRAWEKYCDFKQYSDKNNQKEMKKLALKNLEEILKFAEHK